jgi:hypothetical protein
VAASLTRVAEANPMQGRTSTEAGAYKTLKNVKIHLKRPIFFKKWPFIGKILQKYPEK